MTAPTRRLNGRQGALPEPELVSLTDEPADAQRVIPAPWWTQYGGVLDPASGVIAFPPNSLPPCRITGCQRCADRRAGE